MLLTGAAASLEMGPLSQESRIRGASLEKEKLHEQVLILLLGQHAKVPVEKLYQKHALNSDAAAQQVL